MLKGISPLISPELLKVLCEMGHGDEIVLADANFPAESMGRFTASSIASKSWPSTVCTKSPNAANFSSIG